MSTKEQDLPEDVGGMLDKISEREDSVAKTDVEAEFIDDDSPYANGAMSAITLDPSLEENPSADGVEVS